MKVLVAPDKFRGCLSAAQAADAIAQGVLAAWPEAVVTKVPLADGGEGTVDALVRATRGRTIDLEVEGPLGRPVEARYGILGDGRTAVIEMASASGHAHIPPGQKDPSKTHTRGTGQLLKAAIAEGCTKVILGIGGSATNDGGAGLATALGYRLLDEQGEPIEPTGGGLARIERIDSSQRLAALDRVEISVACDVNNPLCGSDGASVVFGPQKGASRDMVAILDRNLARFARVIERDLGRSVADLPGAGAAGGLGAGLVAFAGGKLVRGIDLVLETLDVEHHLADAALCLTGEGSIDGSSTSGKVVVGLARFAQARGRPVIALAGTLGPGAEEVLDEGVTAIFSLCSRPMAITEAMFQAAPLLSAIAEQATRAFHTGLVLGKRWASSN